MKAFRLTLVFIGFFSLILRSLSAQPKFVEPDADEKFLLVYIYGSVISPAGDTLATGDSLAYKDAIEINYVGDTGNIAIFNKEFGRFILPRIKPEAELLYHDFQGSFWRYPVKISYGRKSYSFTVEETNGLIRDLYGQKIWPGSTIKAKSANYIPIIDSTLLPDSCICLWHHFDYVGDTSWAVVSHPTLGRFRIPDIVQHRNPKRIARFPCGSALKPEDE